MPLISGTSLNLFSFYVCISSCFLLLSVWTNSVLFSLEVRHRVLPSLQAHHHRCHLMRLSSKLFICWLVLLTVFLHLSLQSACLISSRLYR